MDKQFLRLSDKWALAHDRQQWIVQKRQKDYGRGEWRSVSFIGSNKRVLMRVMTEAGVDPTPDALDALQQFPERFVDWYADHMAAETWSPLLEAA